MNTNREEGHSIISRGLLPSLLLSLLAMLFQSGCSGLGLSPSSATDVSVETGNSPEELEMTARTLVSTSRHMAELSQEVKVFLGEAQSGWTQRGYLTSEEDDRVEDLLFRYLAIHEALWNLVHQNKDFEANGANDPVSVRRAIIAFNAGFTQFHNDALFVSRFQGDNVAIAKLNEEFYRAEIPQGTYDRMKLNVTDAGKVHALEKAWRHFSQELDDQNSMLAHIDGADPFYRDLIDQTRELTTSIDDNIQAIVEADGGMFPSLRNELRHTHVAAAGRETDEGLGDFASATRAFLFKSVSRLKSPTAHLIKFSDTQKTQVYDALRPGDILLSYTAGYMSDVFIPGAFKHAMVYVGSPEDRRNAGLDPDRINDVDVPSMSKEALAHAINEPRTVSGAEADLIEAVAEGVKFSNLAQIMDTHINRLLILRPQLDRDAKREALTEVFLFLRDGYDFKFDFADASEQVCTEVVYRAYNEKGSLAFSLTKRAGRETLSADDIVNYYVRKDPRAFSFVLLAVEDPKSKDHRAEILEGDRGLEALSQLMEATKS